MITAKKLYYLYFNNIEIYYCNIKIFVVLFTLCNLFLFSLNIV